MALPQQTNFHVRSFQAPDQAACQKLYLEGLHEGAKIADNDTGLDIDDIQAAYMNAPGNHCWVAEITDDKKKSEIIGMIGVQHHDEGVGEIRRLRVRTDY